MHEICLLVPKSRIYVAEVLITAAMQAFVQLPPNKPSPLSWALHYGGEQLGLTACSACCFWGVSVTDNWAKTNTPTSNSIHKEKAKR